MVEEYVINGPIAPIQYHSGAPKGLKELPSVQCQGVKVSPLEMENALSKGCERSYQRYQQLMQDK